MRITITERQCEVGKRTLDRAESQLGQLAKFEQRATAAELVFTEGRRSKSAEVVVHIDGAPHVTARGEGDSFRSALDQVVDRLRRIVKEQRERRREHQAPRLSERIAGK